MDRRLFLKRAASLIAAPAIIPIHALMPVRGIALEDDLAPPPIWYSGYDTLWADMVSTTLKKHAYLAATNIPRYNAFLRKLQLREY